NIQQSCTKFSECLDQVGRLNKSGQNEVDNYSNAKWVYYDRRIDHSSLITVGLLSSMPLGGNRWM
ncbi:unnamed protein product, partial [Prunus brigantina]